MRVLHLDTNHPLLIEQLRDAGFENVVDLTGSKEEIQQKIDQFDGLVIRSRIPIDQEFLKHATRLKFIGRVGAGLENIDTAEAERLGIALFNAPEGNRNAVGEHALGMLLMLMNRLHLTNREVRQGLWEREGNRGWELEGRTVGIIGYGNMGRSFARKLKGFDCRVICHDILPGLGDEYAEQVDLETLQQQAEVLSLHTPLTPLTDRMVNSDFLRRFKQPIWLINTARGRCVVTAALVKALDDGRVIGAALDVLEYEKRSFENLFEQELPESLVKLFAMDNVVLSPHVAGWTHESKAKLAQTIVDKILMQFKNSD
jgi:D-3-phosphoglycerate dehydrogenase